MDPLVCHAAMIAIPAQQKKRCPSLSMQYTLQIKAIQSVPEAVLFLKRNAWISLQDLF